MTFVEPVFSPDQFAELLDCSRRTIDNYDRDGRLPNKFRFTCFSFYRIDHIAVWQELGLVRRDVLNEELRARGIDPDQPPTKCEPPRLKKSTRGRYSRLEQHAMSLAR